MHLSAYNSTPFSPPRFFVGILFPNWQYCPVGQINPAMSSKKTQARDLYAQTALTKTQIAATLGIHRNTISTWVREGDWDRLKAAGQNLPSILAENCYHIMGHLTEHYLSEWRLTDPISHKEADTLYKLACTISKLRSRTTINETMEMMGAFSEDLRKQNKKLAGQLRPYVDKYLARQAKISVASLLPQEFTAPGGRIPGEVPDETEERKKETALDNREAFFRDPDTVATYNEYQVPLPADMNPPDFPAYIYTEATNNTAQPDTDAAKQEEPVNTVLSQTTATSGLGVSAPAASSMPATSSVAAVNVLPATTMHHHHAAAQSMHNHAQSMPSQIIDYQSKHAQNCASGNPLHTCTMQPPAALVH